MYFVKLLPEDFPGNQCAAIGRQKCQYVLLFCFGTNIFFVRMRSYKVYLGEFECNTKRPSYKILGKGVHNHICLNSLETREENSKYIMCGLC